MLAAVLGHRAETGEATAADITVEWTLTSMRSSMFCILLAAYERLPAVIADVDHPFSSANQLLWLRYSVAAVSFDRSLDDLVRVLG